MANAFNLTAQLNLRGPANIKPVVDQIRKQLGSINANVNVTIASSATRNVAALTASLNKLNTSLGQTTTNASSAANAISKLSSAIRGADASKLGASLTAAANASNKLAKQQQITQKNLNASRTEMEEFGKQAALAIRRFAAFSTVTAVVYQLNNAISSGVQSFIAFDKEFVKLQQVTGESARNLSELRNEITRLSTGLGVTSQDLTQVSSTLAQAGLNARETRQALEALALSALAPSFDNLNDTVEGSIALMRQFGISSTELGSALGSVNAVAAAFAVEAGDIIKAIQRTGGVFANASKGVTEGTDALNEFISVFTSVRQTTRESAETIATGLRTIFTRIQRGSTIQALKEYGVQLTDLEGKFVGPYKAVQLLSEGLGRIDPRDLRFSQIVEELGGFRQIGKVIPLIQQFSVAQRALAVAQEGQSSLAEDAAIAQLSLANQISKVREEFLSLFREIGSSDTFQFVTKGALSLTSGLIRLTDSLKNVLPVFAIITAAKGLSAITQFGAGFGKGIRRGGGQQNVPAVAGFAKGGLVPGSGNTDSVPAMLTPGEFVFNKKAVSKYGRGNLVRMNKYARGGGPRSSLVQDVSYQSTYDGDSLIVDYTPKPEPYRTSTRLVGYDAYELDRGTAAERKKGLQAKNITEAWASKQGKNLLGKFEAASGKKDKYGRPMFDAPALGKRLVDAGVAIPYTGSGDRATSKYMGGIIQKYAAGSAGGVKNKSEPFGTGTTKFPRRISNAYAKEKEKAETAIRFDRLIQKSPINERIMVDEAMEQQIAQGMRQPLDREQFTSSFRRAILRDEIASNISNFAKLVGLPQEDLSVVLPRQLDFGSGSGPIGSRGGRDVLGGAFTTISPYGSRGAEGWDLSEFGYTKQDEQDLFGFEKLLEEKQKERAKIRKTPTRTFDDGSTSFDLQAYDKASDEYNALNQQIYDIRTKRDAAISAANKAREEEVASSGRATLGFGTRFGKAQNPVFYHELTHQLFKGLRAKSADSFDKYKQRVTTLFETDNDGLADAFDALNAGYSSADVVYGRAYKLDLLGYKQREEIRKDPAAEEAKNLSSLIKSGIDAKKATQFRPINPSFNEAMLKFYSQEHLDKVEDNGKEEFLTTLVEKMPVLDQRLQGILDSTMTELLAGAGIQRQKYVDGGWVERMKTQPDDILRRELEMLHSGSFMLSVGERKVLASTFAGLGKYEDIGKRELVARMQAIKDYLDERAINQKAKYARRRGPGLQATEKYNEQEMLDAVNYYAAGSGPFTKALVSGAKTFKEPRGETYKTKDIKDRLLAASQFTIPKKTYSGLGRSQFREILSDTNTTPKKLATKTDETLRGLVGQTIDFPTFLSVSAQKDQAEAFVQNPGALLSIDGSSTSQKTIDVVKARRKTQIDDSAIKSSRRLKGVENISEKKLDIYEEEQEFIIPPNVGFKITKATGKVYQDLSAKDLKSKSKKALFDDLDMFSDTDIDDFDKTKLDIKVQMLRSGGTVQKFMEGGVAQRKLGYIDYDVIANPANEAVVTKGMEATGVSGPRLYTDKLIEMAVRARKEQSLNKLRAIYGVAGAGKTTLARGQGTDKGTLRETERFPILSPEDIQRANEIILLSSSVSKDKLDTLFADVDRAYTLSSTTPEEKAIIKAQRASRDVTGIGAEGRSPGSTTGVPKDTAVGEALLADRLGERSVVLGRTESGRLRRKRGDELVEIVKKRIGMTWGGFAPMTAGHESILDAAAAMGISPQDFVFLVGANESIKLGDPSSYRTAVFNQDARVLLAKAGAGARGATVVPKAADFEVPLGVDISEPTGRRKVLLPGEGSTVFVGDKTEQQTAKYKTAGYNVSNIGRTGGISGTMVRDLIMAGNMAELQKVLSPGVYELISNNIGRIQNRANVLPDIVEQVKQSQGVKLAEVEQAIKAVGISRIDQKKMEDPEYVAKVKVLEELRSQRDQIKKSSAFEPYRLLDKLAVSQPEQYALDFSQSQATIPAPVRTVKDRALAAVAAETSSVASVSSGDAGVGTGQSLLDSLATRLKALGGESGLKGLGVSIPADLQRRVRTNLIKEGVLDAARVTGLIEKAEAIKKRKQDEIDGTRHVAMAGLQPLDYSRDPEWELDDGRKYIATIRGFKSSYLQDIERFRDRQKAAALEFAKDTTATEALGLLGQKTVQGVPRSLAIDFDDTLAFGTKMLDSSGKEDISAYYDEARVREVLSRATPTRLAQRLAEIEKDQPGTVRAYTRVLTARAESLKHLVTETLNRFGLPYTDSDITGVGQRGDNDRAIARKKGDNLSAIERFIDDSEKNISVAQQKGIQSYRYSEPKAFENASDYEPFGAGNIEGALLEQTLAMKMGRPIDFEALEQNRALDFPNGLGAAASLFGLPPNIETEVKRTLNKDSFTKARSEFNRYFKENPEKYNVGGIVASFAKGGKADYYSLEKSSGLSSGEFDGMVRYAKTNDFSLDEFRSYLSKRAADKKSRVGSVIDPKSLQSFLMHGAVGPRLGTGDLTEEQKKLVAMLKGPPDPQYDPGRFASGGTVPALVSNGEAYVPPKMAKRIGYGKLNRMNQADRNGMGRFSEGGISVFKGPGSGTSDSIPTNLPVGSFIIREKATKALGLAKGGGVGAVQSFRFGGNVDYRPDVVTSSTAPIINETIEALQILDQTLRALGSTSSKASEIINSGRITNYKSAIDAAQADINRAKLMGASIQQISDAEKALQNIRNQSDKSVKTRRSLQQISETDQARISAATVSPYFEAGVQRRIKAAEQKKKKLADQAYAKTLADTGSRTEARKARDKISVSLSDKEQNKIREQEYLKTVASKTGISTGDLRKQGLSSDIIQKYMAETALDPKAAKRFNTEYLKARQQDLQNTLNIATGSNYTAAEAKKLAKQELAERAKIAKEVRKSQGLGTRLSEFASKSNIGLSLALPVITDLFAGGEATSASGAATQAATQGVASSVSSSLALASFGGPAGLAAAGVTLVSGLAKTFAEAQNAVVDFTNKLSRSKIEEATERLSRAFDKLSQDVKNAAILGDIERDLKAITVESNQLMNSNITDIRYGLLNLFESSGSTEGFERSRILQNQGVTAYIRSLIGGDETRQRLFSREEPLLAKENAKLFTAASEQTQRYIQALVEAGKTQTDLISDPAFMSIAQNLALADASIQRALADIDDPAQKAQFLKDVTQTRAAEFIEISFRAKELKDLNTATKELSLSFNRLFDTMDQSINAVNYGLKQFADNLSASVDSLSGSGPKIQAADLQSINILQNPLAYSKQEFNQATQVGSSLFGNDATLVNSLLKLGPSLEDSLLSTINNILKTSGDQPEIAKGRVNREVRDQLSNLGLPADLASKLAREIGKAVGDIADETDKGAISLQELTEKISGLGDILETSKKANASVTNALKYWQDALNSYSDQTNKAAELQVAAAAKLRRANDILFESTLSLASALGKDIDLSFIERSLNNTIAQRTGGLTDPVAITNALFDLERRRSTQQANLAATQSNVGGVGAEAAIIKTTRELSQTNVQIAETRAALEDLANNSELASAALNKIQQAQQKQAGRVSFIEKLVTSTPEQLKSLNNAFANLQRYASGQTQSIQQSTAAQKAYREALKGGATRREAQKAAQEAFAGQRSDALSLLNDISPFLGSGQQANNIRASALETMLRESGIGINPMMQQVLNAVRNPEADPETKAAIETYKSAIRTQAEANKQLARINSSLAADIAQSTAKAIKEALSAVTLKFDDKAMQDLADAIRTLKPAQARADGGIIYASQGSFVDFAPKGTDTVPAMLTPGEFVVNRTATQQNRPLLEAINNGYAKGGKVRYYAAGGYVAGSFAGGDDVFKGAFDNTKLTPDKYAEPKSLSSQPYEAYTNLGYGVDLGSDNSSFIKFRSDNLEFQIGNNAADSLKNNEKATLSLSSLQQGVLFPNIGLSRSSQNPVSAATIEYKWNGSDGSALIKDEQYLSTPTSYGALLYDTPNSTAKQLKEADIPALISQYDSALNKMFRIEEKGQTYDVQQPAIVGNTSFTIPKVFSQTLSNAPEAELSASQGYFIDSAMLRLSNIGEPFGQANYGIGFVNSSFSPNTGPQFSTDSSPTSNTYKIGAGGNLGIGSISNNNSIRSAIPNAVSNVAEYLDKIRNIKDKKESLENILANPSLLQYSDESQQTQQIWDKLNKIFSSNSVYISELFDVADGLNFALLGGKKTNTTVYGGKASDFDSLFKNTIQDQIDGGKTNIQSSALAGSKPINIKPDDPAILSKSFAWTQGISLSELDPNAPQKTAEAEQALAQIITSEQNKRGKFTIPLNIDGKITNTNIPYDLLYQKVDGKLWNSNTSAYSGKKISQISGGPLYALGTSFNSNIQPAGSVFDGLTLSNANDLLAVSSRGFNNDALINSAALVKDQFNKPAVKKYLAEALKANKYDISLLSSAKSATRTRISGNKTGSGLFNFVKSINGTFEDFSDPTNTISVQTGADIEFGKYLETVAKQLISDKASAAAISSTTAFKPSDFTSTLSDPALLGPAFETIGKTAYELFGQGGPYQYGNFGINLGGADPKKLTREQIRQASSALSAQLTNMLTALDQEMNDPAANPALFDLYNNGQVLMSGALKALSGLANADTNLITRYLNPTDLRTPNFNWLALKDNALTMFRAFGAISSGRLSGFLNQTLTPDDQIDLQSILGNKDKFKTVDKTGKVGDDAALPQLSTINDVLKLALNPYNQFDETTDRSILLNALQARLINAKDGQGRSVFSRQMMLYTLDNLEALRVWFGGEPGANIKFANPPTGFDADGLPIASGSSAPSATPTAPTTLAGALATGLSNLANAAINTVSGAASNVASAVGLGGLAGMFGMKTNTWSGIDYLYDQTPPTPDWATRLQALRDGFDSTLYDNAAKAFAELGAITEFGTLPSLDYYAGLPAVQYKQTGGMIYASQGQLVNFEPKGTDTVPAMLTPGEFVVNRAATQKHLPLLKAINSGVGGYSIGGVVYAADGAQVPRGSNIRVRNRNKPVEDSPLISGLAAGATEYGAGVLDTAGALFGGALPALLSAPVAAGEQLGNLIYGNRMGSSSSFGTDVFRSSLGNLQKPSERINKGLLSAGVYDPEIFERPGSYLSGASTEQLTQQLSPEAQLTALGLDFASPDAGDVSKIPGAANKLAGFGLMPFFFQKKSTGFMGMEKTIDYRKPTVKGAAVAGGLAVGAGYLLNTYFKEMGIQPSAVSKEFQEARSKSNAELEAQRANTRKALGLSSGGLVYLAEGGMAAVRDDVRNLRTTFNQLDKDKNALLTADEYAQRQDWNKDGGVDWSEFSRPESLATAAFAGMASMFGAADLVPAFPQDVDPAKQRQVDRTQKVASKRSRDRAAKADMSARQQAFATQTAARQAFQRARTRALNEGQTIAEANNAGMQAQQTFMTQAASDPSILDADKRDSQLEFRSNARVQTLATKAADKAFDDALAAGKTEDEAYDAYQQAFDREKKKPGLMADARQQVTQEQKEREARRNQLYTIDDVGKVADTDWADRASGFVNGQPAMRLSDMTGPERNAIRAKRAAEKKQQEKDRRQSEIDAAIKAKREQEAIERAKRIAQENRDRVLYVDRELNTGKYGSTYAEKDKRRNEARASIIAKRYTFSSQPNADGQKYSVTGEISEVDFSGDPPTVVFQKIDPKTGMPLTRTNAQGEQENVYTKPVPLDRLDPTSQQLVRTETKTNRDLVNRTYGDKVYSSLEDRNAVKAEADEAWKKGQLDELEKRSDDRQRARDEARKSGDTATYADILRSQNIPEDTIAQVVGSLDEELQRKQQRQTTQDRENLQAKVNAFAEREARRFARENRELAIADRKRQEDEAFVALQLSLAEEDRYEELREKARRKKIKPLSNEDLELAQMERDRGVKFIDDGGQFASQNAHKKIENTRREAMSAQQIATEDRARRLRFEEDRRQKGLDGTAFVETVTGFAEGLTESGPGQTVTGLLQTSRYGVQNTLVAAANLTARGLRDLPSGDDINTVLNLDEFVKRTDNLLQAGSLGVYEGIGRTLGGVGRAMETNASVFGLDEQYNNIPGQILDEANRLNEQKLATQQQYVAETDRFTQNVFGVSDAAADVVFDPLLPAGFGRAALKMSNVSKFDNLGIAMRPQGVSPTPGKMGLMRIADELPSINTGLAQADNLPNINLNIPRLTQNQKIGKWLLENGKDVGLTRQQIDEAFELAYMTGETEYVNELVSTVAKQRAMKQVELNRQLQQGILDSETIQTATGAIDTTSMGSVGPLELPTGFNTSSDPFAVTTPYTSTKPIYQTPVDSNLPGTSLSTSGSGGTATSLTPRNRGGIGPTNTFRTDTVPTPASALGDTAPTNLPRSQAANSTRQSLIQRGMDSDIVMGMSDNELEILRSRWAQITREGGQREKAIAQWIQDNTPMTSNTETLPIPTNQTPSNLVNSSQGATNSSGLPASLDTRTKYEKWADIYDPNADIWDPLRTEAIKNPEFAKVLKQRRGYSNGGIVYANNGALIAAQSYGSDTVPAMLTPGEFVINRNATQQHKPLLEAINSGQYTTGGIVRYLAAGGYITPQRLQNGSMEPIKNAQNIRSNGGVNTSVSTEQPSWVSDFMNSISALGPMLSSVGAAFTKSATELASNIPSDGITIQSDVNVTGSVGLASDTLGRAVNMGAQQGMQYTDQTQLAANQKMMRETDGGISFA